MAQRHDNPRGWPSRHDDRRFLRDEDRRYGRREDDDDPRSREMEDASGRYSGSEQAEDRHRLEGGRVSGARYQHGEGSHGGGMEHPRGDADQGRRDLSRRYEDQRGRAGAYGDDRRYGRKSAEHFGAADPARGSGARQAAQGRYRGIGPKGYIRSDERIREDVCDSLAVDPHLDASNIEVAVRDAEVTLSGTVGSREDKRRAEDLADHSSGVKHVQNSLRIGAAGGPRNMSADADGQ